MPNICRRACRAGAHGAARAHPGAGHAAGSTSPRAPLHLLYVRTEERDRPGARLSRPEAAGEAHSAMGTAVRETVSVLASHADMALGEPTETARTDCSPTTVDLCGGLVGTLSGRRLDEALPGRQGRLLFAYLVDNRDRVVARDELMSLLWPDAAPERPAAVLKTLIARLRRAL